MNHTVIKNKIITLEAELSYIKQALTQEPDFSVDERNWRKIRSEVKGIRKKLAKRQYEKK